MSSPPPERSASAASAESKDEPVEIVKGHPVSPESVEPDDDLPVVARLVVEIRSDGRRTVARGGLEDVASGQRVTIDARGDSPVALALALARSIMRLPRLAARTTVRGLLGRRKP